MMATNTEGLAIFIRGKGHSCEIFTQGHEKIWGPENFITPCIKFNGCALKAFKVNFSYLTVPQNPGPIQRNDESGRNGAFIGCMINVKIPEYYK